MDSITHSLYKAIAAEHARQNAKITSSTISLGLAPLHTRKLVWQGFQGAHGTDLYISLEPGSPELLALQMEFIAGGFSIPASSFVNGIDVIITGGAVELTASTDDGDKTWMATLSCETAHDITGKHRRTSWKEAIG